MFFGIINVHYIIFLIIPDYCIHLPEYSRRNLIAALKYVLFMQ